MSMRKLLGALATVLICTSINAEEKLEPIVVESSIFNQHSSTQHARAASIITADKLANKNVTTLGDAVNNEPGISTSNYAPGASRPIIRGQSAHRVMVLENGVSSGDVSALSDDHAVSIEPIHAERIEILHGPATLRYGPEAVGGLVNVINNRIPQMLPEQVFSYELQLEHATVSEGDTISLDLNGKLQNFTWHFDALDRNTKDYDIDGYADEDDPENKGTLKNSDIDTEDYSLGGSYITDKFLFGFSYSNLDSNYGLPGGHAHGHEDEHDEDEHDEEHHDEDEHDEEHHDEEINTRIDLKQKRYDAQLEFFKPFSNIETVLLRTTYNDYRHRERDGEHSTTFDNESWNTRLEFVQHNGESQHNAFGIQYVDVEFSALGEEALIDPVDEQNVGIFALTKRAYDQWDLELGARLDRIEYDIDTARDKDFTTTSLSMGVINYVGDATLLKFNADFAERAPQNIALYANGAHLATEVYEIGSTDIDEETAFEFNLSLEHIGTDYTWKVNTFYNYMSDYIYLANTDENNDGIADLVDEDGDLELDGELTRGVFSNDDAIFYGFEAEFAKSLYKSDATDLTGRLFADYVRGEFDDNELGNIPRMTPARLGLELMADYGAWDTSIEGIFVNEQKKVAKLESKTDDYLMLNARLTRTLHNANSTIKLFVKGENLLDEDARQHTSFRKNEVPLPGRNIRLGLSVHY